jgi:DNA-binding MarR family transcriptional regulator
MITPTQSKLLTALLAGEQTRTELRYSSGVYGSTATHAIAVLIKEGYITDEKLDGTKTRIITITHAGRRALKRLEKSGFEGPKVAPQTISRMTGHYTPPRVFLRNDGHAHIGSYGYGC